jgi:hypothetical protein
MGHRTTEGVLSAARALQLPVIVHGEWIRQRISRENVLRSNFPCFARRTVSSSCTGVEKEDSKDFWP